MVKHTWSLAADTVYCTAYALLLCWFSNMYFSAVLVALFLIWWQVNILHHVHNVTPSWLSHIFYFIFHYRCIIIYMRSSFPILVSLSLKPLSEKHLPGKWEHLNDLINVNVCVYENCTCNPSPFRIVFTCS